MTEDHVILKTKGLTKKFGGVKAVDNVTSYFIKGRIYVILGPNGAGKTTFYNLLSGFFPPDNGEIFFDNFNITKKTAWERSRLGISRLFQDIRSFSNLSALDNLLCFSENPYSKNPLTLPILKKKASEFERKDILKAKEILEAFNLPSDKRVKELSYGQQKLVALGRLKMIKSNLLLLDEPFAGLHQEFREVLKHFLLDYVKNGNTAIIIEHDIAFISEFVEWVYLFVEGKRVTFGKIEEILSSEEVVKGIWGI